MPLQIYILEKNIFLLENEDPRVINSFPNDKF